MIAWPGASGCGSTRPTTSVASLSKRLMSRWCCLSKAPARASTQLSPDTPWRHRSAKAIGIRAVHFQQVSVGVSPSQTLSASQSHATAFASSSRKTRCQSASRFLLKGEWMPSTNVSVNIRCSRGGHMRVHRSTCKRRSGIPNAVLDVSVG